MHNFCSLKVCNGICLHLAFAICTRLRAIRACVCVGVSKCVWVGECVCIPYIFNYYLPCTRAGSRCSSSSSSRNTSSNMQTTPTKILTKYICTHAHTYIHIQYIYNTHAQVGIACCTPSPSLKTFSQGFAICIKDFYARCKQ